jgi:branched-subunit amino acid ABC-type transport system permease component
MEFLFVTLIGVIFAIASLVLLSLGLAIIYGMMGVINLAQGEFIMLGAYTVILSSAHGLGVWGGIALAPFVVGAIGLVIERCIIRFLYGRLLDTMLATWGLSLAIIAAVTLVLGPTTEGVATPLGHVAIGDYALSVYNLFVIAAATTSMAFVWALFNFTRFGLIARGTMQNADMVAALGVHPPTIYMATFALGSALAGLAGAVMAPLTGVVPSLGLAYIAKVFITVTVGGSAIFGGTLGASALLGAIESAVSFISTPIYGQVAMLACALLVLRIVPQGISALWRRRG